jgi:hypothetical protein
VRRRGSKDDCEESRDDRDLHFCLPKDLRLWLDGIFIFLVMVRTVPGEGSMGQGIDGKIMLSNSEAWLGIAYSLG